MINSELSDKLGYDFQTLKNYITNWQPVKELEWVANSPDGRFVRKLTDEEREHFDLGWYELKKAKPELEITYQDFVDNKIIIDKQPRKLFKYLNDKELSELVGKYKLPKTDLYVVISTNFDDFLMCSTGNNWTACTDLRTGDFRYTTAGNIFLDGRFIVYITDLKPKEFEGLQSFNMFFRCFGFVNEDGKMVSNIWYPIKEYMSVDSLGVISVKEAANKRSKYGINIVFNKYDAFVYPYLDYCIIDNDKFEFADKYLRFHPIVGFSNGEVAYCGEYLKFDGELDYDKALWKFCDMCGEKHGFIKTFGDKNYCPTCYEQAKQKCYCCDKEYNLKDMKFGEESHFYCKQCMDATIGRTDYKTCSCGTTIRKKNEVKCKYCRSGKEDAFKNIEYSYIYNGNNYDYFRHHYIDDKLPPGIKYDEDVFEETEKYVRR